MLTFNELPKRVRIRPKKSTTLTARHRKRVATYFKLLNMKIKMKLVLLSTIVFICGLKHSTQFSMIFFIK